MKLEFKLGGKCEKVRGVQAGIGQRTRDMGGVQAGSYNEAEELRGLQTGIMNVVEEYGCGAQVALPAPFGMNIVYEAFDGLQVGMTNFVKKKLRGVQMGLLCYANSGTFLQLGLLTVRGVGPRYTRYTPFIGFHLERKAKGVK